MEQLTFDPIAFEDLDWGTGLRERRLQDGRVVGLHRYDPGWNVAARSNVLTDYVGNGRTTLISQRTELRRNVTVPRGETLYLPDGGELWLYANITCYGRIAAGKNQIFFGPGRITFPEGATVQGEWWGAKGDATTDSADAIETALNANTYGMHVQLGDGIFLVGSTITSPTGPNLDWAIRGTGMRRTYLRRTPGYTGALLTVGNTGLTTNRFYLECIGFDGIDKASGTIAVRGIRAGQANFRDVYVTQCETGIWLSGGSYAVVDNCYCDQNTTAVLFDNATASGFTFARVETTLFRNNETAMFINGNAVSTNLVRNISLYRNSFENDALGSGTDIGLKIVQAEQVHCHECWFEDNSYHVHITGSNTDLPATRLAQYLSFVGCNFGKHNAAALNPEAFHFIGTAINDGRGCYMQACRINEGEFQFDQDVRFAIRDCEALGGGVGGAEFTGNSWYQILTTDSESETYSELATKTNWRPRQMLKNDGVAQYRMRETYATGRTTNATVTTIAEFVFADFSTAYVNAYVLARQSDNSEQKAWHVAALFVKSAGTADPGDGTVAQVPSTTDEDEHPAIESAGASAWAFEIDTLGGAGSSIRFRATGAAATDIDWQIWATVLTTQDA